MKLEAVGGADLHALARDAAHAHRHTSATLSRRVAQGHLGEAKRRGGDVLRNLANKRPATNGGRNESVAVALVARAERDGGREFGERLVVPVVHDIVLVTTEPDVGCLQRFGGAGEKIVCLACCVLGVGAVYVAGGRRLRSGVEAGLAIGALGETSVDGGERLIRLKNEPVLATRRD
eukprot:SAG11_NODE_125_length_15744_cov_50.316075_7_plen_177_part_00